MGRNLDSACIAYEYVFGAAFVYVVAVVFVLSSIGMLLYTTETCALTEGFFVSRYSKVYIMIIRV